MQTLPSVRTSAVVASLLALMACNPNSPLIQTAAPTSIETTATYEALRNLPAPKQPVPVAVYSYPDLTGQFKAAETVSTNSRAVTQGAVWMLVKSLKDAAAGRWFKVIQRANLDNLLKERQIIRETRGRVEQDTGQSQPGLPSLLFAGVILEGGIIGYDSNTVTGGLGARYLGIGGDVQYRQDTVSVYLNAVSSQTGEVLKSVMTRKTVVSYGMRGSVFKFVSFQKLLEGETGYTVNEPGQIALAQAVEHAVRSMIIEGALEGLWQFEDEIAGKEVTQAYLADREDDFLIGDASSLVAQTLLSEDQLQKIADARKAKRQRLEEQELRRQERQLVAERKKASEAAQRELAAAQTSTPENVMGPIATPAQLAALKRRHDVERSSASAVALNSEQQTNLVGLAAAEAEASKVPELGAAGTGEDQETASNQTPSKPQDEVGASPVDDQDVVAKEEKSEPSKKVAKDEPEGDDSTVKTGVVPTSTDEKEPRPAAKKRRGPTPLPIQQPGAVIESDTKEADEANVLDSVPKLKPASSQETATPPTAATLLRLGGQTVMVPEDL